MLKIALIVAGVLVALVAVMALIGLFLPRDHVASRSRHFTVAREAVWIAIRDVEHFTAWRSDVRRVELVADVGGPPGFREHGAHGSVLYAIDVDERPSKLVTRIADESLPYGGTWTLELRDVDGGCELTITERGFVKNPVFRLLSKTVFSQVATIERYLESLAAEVEKPRVGR